MSTRQKKNMNLLIIFMFCFFVPMLVSCSKDPNNYDSSGSKQWTMQWGAKICSSGSGVAIDSLGNIYVTGFSDSGPIINTNGGDCDIFLTKYNSSGVSKWTRHWGTKIGSSGTGVVTDSSGNIYVTGITFGNLDGNTNRGNEDIFLTKYDSSGAKQWTRQWGTSNFDWGKSVATDSSGNIYVTGWTIGNLDGNTNAGSSDIFLTKYDSSGSKQWTRQWGTSGIDWGERVATDSSGNIYVTGFTVGGLDGNINAGGDDIFLTKYSSSGVKQWTRQWGTKKDDRGSSAAIDSSGNIFVTGYTKGELDNNTNMGGYDIFLTKYSSSGIKQWTRQWGTAKDDKGSCAAIDSSGNIYITGFTKGGLDGNKYAGGEDIFLKKCHSSGAKQWTMQWGTFRDDKASSVATDSSGNIYITGYTKGGLDGNTKVGEFDVFLIKWHKTGIILDK